MPNNTCRVVGGCHSRCEQLKLSRPVFARYLRTNPRTLENWEQGRAKPNAQAALLIRMVAQFPDMVQRLEAV